LADTEETAKLTRLKDWLYENFVTDTTSVYQESKLLDLVQKCHELRGSSLLHSLKFFTGQGQTRSQEFEQLYKLLCKLSKHVTVSRKLIQAAESLPQDFGEELTLRTVPSSTARKLPLIPKEASVDSTVGRMFSSENEKTKFLTRLESIWDTPELSVQLKRQITTKTKVHAELLLVNYFDIHGCIFLDGDDKYIGCSKPACYLCYAYISNHPGRYALPASHQKIYVGWRLPDIYPTELQCQSRLKIQEDILLKIIERVRQDLKTDMESREPRRPYHADSTAGVTSIFDSSVPAMSSELDSLSLGAKSSRSQ
jgi:hypothetical protein